MVVAIIKVRVVNFQHDGYCSDCGELEPRETTYEDIVYDGYINPEWIAENGDIIDPETHFYNFVRDYVTNAWGCCGSGYCGMWDQYYYNRDNAFEIVSMRLKQVTQQELQKNNELIELMERYRYHALKDNIDEIDKIKEELRKHKLYNFMKQEIEVDCRKQLYCLCKREFEIIFSSTYDLYITLKQYKQHRVYSSINNLQITIYKLLKKFEEKVNYGTIYMYHSSGTSREDIKPSDNNYLI